MSARHLVTAFVFALDHSGCSFGNLLLRCRLQHWRQVSLTAGVTAAVLAFALVVAFRCRGIARLCIDSFFVAGHNVWLAPRRYDSSDLATRVLNSRVKAAETLCTARFEFCATAGLSCENGT